MKTVKAFVTTFCPATEQLLTTEETWTLGDHVGGKGGLPVVYDPTGREYVFSRDSRRVFGRPGRISGEGVRLA